MKSFFEKLTGNVSADDEMDEAEELYNNRINRQGKHEINNSIPNDIEEDEETWNDNEVAEEEELDGELTVDMYQKPDSIVIKTMIAGVKPEDLDITITRDMVTIRGTREEKHIISEDDYFARELYWGSFSRAIKLPAEIDIETAEASEEHGLLTIKLPKVDKGRQTKLKIKKH